MKKITPAEIDTLLPQTQCQECGYQGCLPYAEAIARGEEAINRCAPGGIDTLQALAKLLDEDPQPHLEFVQSRAKPEQVAKIREAECIGCMKCIKACPVDAIMGSNKLMHVVIADECTGCELCVEPCPMDCIDIIALAESRPHTKQAQADHARQRYYQHQQRIQQRQAERYNKLQAAKKPQQTIKSANEAQAAKQTYIAEAIARVKNKRDNKD